MDPDPSAVFRNYSQFDNGLNYQFNSAPVVTPPPEPVPVGYESDNTAPADPIYNFDPSPEDVRNSTGHSLLDVESVKETPEAPIDDTEKNIVAAWADEYYRMTHQKHAEMVQMHNQQIPQSFRPSVPLPPYDFSQSLKRTLAMVPQEGLPSRMVPIPTAVTSPIDDGEKRYKCDICNTFYKTPARLKRHYGTKKHKSMTEIMNQADPNVAAAVATPPKNTTQQSSTTTPDNHHYYRRANIQNNQSQEAADHVLPKFSTTFNQQQQHLLPEKPPPYLPPQYRNYGESTHNVNFAAYPPDWSVFQGHIDYMRSSQNLYSPSPEPQSVYSYSQSHYNPELYYNKVTFGSLCNSHQSAFNQVQSPQRMSDSVPSPDQQTPRSYSYPPNYYQPQNQNSWYYPHYPSYPNPNPAFFQRSTLDYPVSSTPFQKLENNNNNYLPDEQPDEQRQVIFDQRPYQQTSQWNPNTPVQTPDDSNEYTDVGSETISPAESPDSRNEAVVTSTESTEDLIPGPVTSLVENGGSETGDEDEGEEERKCDGDVSGDFSNSDSNSSLKRASSGSGESPFKSSIRSKRVAKKSSATQYSDRPKDRDNRHKCDSCDLRMRTKSDLRRHQVSHTGETLHRCNLCPKNFARKDHLARHLRTHKEIQR